jgi:hypothetical protein
MESVEKIFLTAVSAKGTLFDLLASTFLTTQQHTSNLIKLFMLQDVLMGR